MWCERHAGLLQDGGKCCLARALWYSTHLQWLLSCPAKPHSCGSNLSQSPKRCWAIDKGPPLPLLLVLHREVAMWGMSHRQVAGHPCLWASVASWGLWTHFVLSSAIVKIDKYENCIWEYHFCEGKFKLVFPCFYFGCHLSWQLTSSESKGSLVPITCCIKQPFLEICSDPTISLIAFVW